MRDQKQRKNMRIAPLLLAAAVLVGVAEISRVGGGALEKAGENAALFLAGATMPDLGLAMLRDRLRSEVVFERDEGEGTFIPAQTVWPPPQVAEQEQDHGEAAEAVDSQATQPPASSVRPPRIPDRYAAPIINENFSGRGLSHLIEYGNGLIKNDTRLDADTVEDILEIPWGVYFEETLEPQVLIVHTHATESFERFDRDIYDIRNTWRSTDNNNNMVAVGDAMAQVLEENGIGVLHDTTQHDYPSYGGSYNRSAQSIKRYLEEYPTIKIVLDLHRDAMDRNGTQIKPVIMVDGQKAAQIMIISACDSGNMGIPDWRENLRFAAEFQHYMESIIPEITRPVWLCYRKYNMDLTPGSLLVEIGSNANTLEEAVFSARLAGEALSELIWNRME